MRFILGILAAAGMLFSVCSVPAAEGASMEETPLTNLIPGWPQMTPIKEASAVVMDADNGGILYSLNRDTIRYPASTTKIMTALLAIENADPGEIVTIDETGLVYTTDGSTNAGTVAGEEFTVEQCLYISLLKSANDIATQLGKHVAGSVEAFAAMMNERAEEIGCVNTHFVNPSGMPDTEHYTTAGDMALIMRECLKNDFFRKIISTRSYTVPPTNKCASERVYDNHCSLIMPSSEYYYEPCIGGKTGFTQAAWRTLVTAAEKDGRTLICVTMRGPDKTDYTDTANLFEYGFNNFSVTAMDGVPVNLPDDFDQTLLEKEQVPLGGDTAEIVWKYKKMPVGSLIVSTETDRAEAASPAGSAGGSSTGEGIVKQAGVSYVPLIVLGALAALVVMLLVATAVSAAGRKKRRRRRRRR